MTAGGAGPSTAAPRWRLERLGSVGSTQDLVRERLDGAGAGVLDGLVVVAREQRGGRGRRGRDWHSPTGGLWLTAAVDDRRFEALPSSAWPAAVTLGIAGALDPGGRAVLVKWPNDLLAAGSLGKLAGVLLERHRGTVLTGVGVNVRNHPPPGGAALADLTPHIPDIAAEVEEALRRVLAGIDAACRMEAADLVHRWEGRDALAGAHVRVADRGSEVAGVALGIASDGRLRIAQHGGEVLLARGHVTWWQRTRRGITAGAP